MFVGATTLLAEAHAPEERVKAQAAKRLHRLRHGGDDGALSSGAVRAAGGWAALSLALPAGTGGGAAAAGLAGTRLLAAKVA